MFAFRVVSRTRLGHSSIARTLPTPQMGAAAIGRRYLQQGYGDDADKSIADTPEAREERSGQSSGSKQQENTGGQSNKAQKSSDSGNQNKSSSKDTSGAQPKILSDSPPREDEQPADVQKHNEELRKRADNAHEKVKDQDVEKDKVSKQFWSGTGGVDRDP